MEKTIHHFIGKHAGQKALVMGLGTSTNEIISEDLSQLITIGVNDIDKVYSPKYLLTVDFSGRFHSDRAETIRNSACEYFFTQIDEWKNVKSLNGRVVMIKLGNRQLGNIDNHGVLDFSNNSPYIGVLLAYQMGCTEIGLIGVDFTPNHCHIQDGVHELVRNNRLAEIDKDYGRLHAELRARKCNLYNLSQTSMLRSLPKMEIKQFVSYNS